MALACTLAGNDLPVKNRLVAESTFQSDALQRNPHTPET